MSLRLVGYLLLGFAGLVSPCVGSVIAPPLARLQDADLPDRTQPVENSEGDKAVQDPVKPELDPQAGKPAKAALDKADQDKAVPEKTAEGKPPVVDPAVAEKVVSEIKSNQLLPPSTRAWVSIADIDRFEKQFDKTRLGQLAENEEFKPFFEAAKEQLQTFLDEKNLRVGLKIGDIIKVRSGEVCIAGVMQDLEGGQPARGSHGLVLLVDVTGKEAKTNEILSEVNIELQKKNGGTIQSLQINGSTVTKLSSQNPKRIRQTRHIFQTTCNGWLLVADNEEIFRDILRRLSDPSKIDKAVTLNSYPAFAKVMSESELMGADTELSWFVDPFGYIQLARKLYEEEQEIREHHEDWASVLQDVGFDAVKGIGGNLGLAVTVKGQELETFSRMFVFAPRENIGEKQQRFFDLVDFENRKAFAIEPHAMIADSAAAFFGGSWDFTKLLWSFGHVWDSIQGEGEFKRMMEDFKKEPDFQVDIPKLVGSLDNQMFVFSATEQPISSDSERAAIGIPLKAGSDHALVFNSLKKMAKGSEVIVLAGKNVIEVDTTKVDEDYDDLVVPGIDDGFEDDLQDDDLEGQPEKRFSLFEKRYMLVQNGILMITNDKQYMRQLIGALPKQKLADAEDYVQVKNVLAELSDTDKVSFRRFVRLDRVFAVNYHILRQGEMANSPTMLGRLLNQLYQSDAKNTGQPRKQRLDGAKLPEDYNGKVAPFLGPTGWVTEVEPDGWRITGCLLKK